MVGDSEALNNILYVSKDRLEALKKDAKKATKKSVIGTMFPADMPDDAVLVPVDITGAIDEFEGAEEMVDKLGVEKTAKALLKAAQLFEKSKENFDPNDRPIPMNVGEWKEEAGEEEEDDAEEEEEEDEDAEEGEEEDEEGDDEEDEDAE